MTQTLLIPLKTWNEAEFWYTELPHQPDGQKIYIIGSVSGTRHCHIIPDDVISKRQTSINRSKMKNEKWSDFDNFYTIMLHLVKIFQKGIIQQC